MYKNIILLISLALLIGCSQTKVEKKVKVEEINSTNVNNVSNALSADFVPEHIRLSHIEVVPH